jgi:flagellar biosynthetic protein FliP
MFSHRLNPARILFSISLLATSPTLLAQEIGQEENLGFEKDFSFSEDEFNLDKQRVTEDADDLEKVPDKPGSVEAAVHFAEAIESLQEPGKLAPVMRIAFTLTLLTLLPAILLTMTSFTRIIIVFSFVRRALTLQTLPPNQILIGLSLFLTYFIMSPTLDKLNSDALQPMMRQDISELEALKRASHVMHGFMMRFTRQKDLALFVELSGMEPPKGPEDIPMKVLIPAYITSELKTAFQMGFVIFLPFLVIDIVVSTVLVAMGMFMLPPPMVSIPLKILLFVLVDGWNLIIKSLALSFT